MVSLGIQRASVQIVSCLVVAGFPGARDSRRGSLPHLQQMEASYPPGRIAIATLSLLL